MKKLFLAAGIVAALLGASSCTSVRSTSSTLDVNTCVHSGLSADLTVSPNKISYVYHPSKKVRRGGEKNVIATAVAEALKANGNADVLVAPQYTVRKKRSNIKEVIVTGYPATYNNFQNISK